VSESPMHPITSRSSDSFWNSIRCALKSISFAGWLGDTQRGQTQCQKGDKQRFKYRSKYMGKGGIQGGKR
jgi:hypothetical protein